MDRQSIGSFWKDGLTLPFSSRSVPFRYLLVAPKPKSLEAHPRKDLLRPEFSVVTGQRRQAGPASDRNRDGVAIPPGAR